MRVERKGRATIQYWKLVGRASRASRRRFAVVNASTPGMISARRLSRSTPTLQASRGKAKGYSQVRREGKTAQLGLPTKGVRRAAQEGAGGPARAMPKLVCLAALASGVESAIPLFRLTAFAKLFRGHNQHRSDEEGLPEKVQT